MPPVDLFLSIDQRYYVDFKKFLPYLGAFVAFTLALIAVVGSLKAPKTTPESWDSLSASVKQVGAAADLTSATAITSKDKTVCIVSKSASGLAGGVAESVTAVKGSTCRIPDVNVDVSACLETPVVVAAPSEIPVVEVVVVAPSETPVVEMVVEEPAPGEVLETPVAGIDVPAAVELAIGPLVAIVQGTLAKSDVSPVVKAWGTGVLAWLDSGRPSIIALVENPAEGKLSFKGVDITGCTP